MSDAFIPLPAKDLAAVYDSEVKRLYLWASGNWNKVIIPTFKRDPNWVGGLKFNLIGYRLPDQDGIEEERVASSVFTDIVLTSVEGDIKEVVVSEAQGDRIVPIAPTDQVYKQ